MKPKKSGFIVFYGWWLWKKKLTVEIDWEKQTYEYKITSVTGVE